MLIEEKKAKIEEIKDFVFEVRTFGITSKDVKFVETIEFLTSVINSLEKENEELKQYDYRNIKLDEKDRLKSPSMPKEKLDLMNNGIAIYKSFDKLFNDEGDTDI